MDGSDPLENYRDPRRARQYGTDLAGRPELVAVSKAELPGAEEVRGRLAEETGGEVLLFSSVTGARVGPRSRGVCGVAPDRIGILIWNPASMQCQGFESCDGKIEMGNSAVRPFVHGTMKRKWSICRSQRHLEVC